MIEAKRGVLMPQMRENLIFCTEETRKNKPVVIIVEGGLGQGKTTLAVEAADSVNGELLAIDSFVGMGGKNFINIFDKHKKDRLILVYDEAGDYAKRGAMTRFNQDLGRIFETFRAFKVIVIICLPRFWWLDNKIYELGVVKMIIHCYGRNENYGRYAVWFPDTIDWLISRAEKLKKMGLPQKLCYGMVSPNQRGIFYDLPKERSDALTKFGLEGKGMISQEAVLSSQGLISIKDICIKLGRSYQYVQRSLKEAKVKPARTFKNKNYYSRDSVESMLDRLYGE